MALRQVFTEDEERRIKSEELVERRDRADTIRRAADAIIDTLVTDGRDRAVEEQLWRDFVAHACAYWDTRRLAALKAAVDELAARIATRER